MILMPGKILSCSDDESIRAWDYQSGECKETVKMDGLIESIHKLPCGQFASLAFDKEEQIHFIYFHGPKSLEYSSQINFEVFHRYDNEVRLLVYLSDGAIASSSGSLIKIFDFQGANTWD